MQRNAVLVLCRHQGYYSSAYLSEKCLHRPLETWQPMLQRLRLTLFSRRTSRKYRHALSIKHLVRPLPLLATSAFGKVATNKDETDIPISSTRLPPSKCRDHHSDSSDASAVAQVPVEEFERQRKGAVGLRLAIGQAAIPCERMISIGILVNGHKRIWQQAPLQQLVDLGLHPAILHGHVQNERSVQALHLANMVFDIGAVIGHGTVDLGAAAHQVAKLAAETISHGSDLAVTLLQPGQIVPSVFHVTHGKVVIEVVI